MSSIRTPSFPHPDGPDFPHGMEKFFDGAHVELDEAVIRKCDNPVRLYGLRSTR